MQRRRAGLHGLLRIENEREILVFHRDCPHALRGGNLVLGDDDRNVVPPVPHMPVQKQPVRHVLMPGIHRPRMSRRRERKIRHVNTRQHLHNARDRLRAGRIDPLHDRVRPVGMPDANIQRIHRHPVLVVFGAAGDLVVPVQTGFAVSNDHNCLLCTLQLTISIA